MSGVGLFDKLLMKLRLFTSFEEKQTLNK